LLQGQGGALQGGGAQFAASGPQRNRIAVGGLRGVGRGLPAASSQYSLLQTGKESPRRSDHPAPHLRRSPVPRTGSILLQRDYFVRPANSARRDRTGRGTA